MKKEIENFINEITTNFSELFVETFLLRYFSNFDKRYLLETINRTKYLLNLKIENKMLKVLNKIEYKEK